MNAPLGTTKEVAKITIEAPVASFRYPHFLIGRQPTFHMPPPSTVYGHVAAVLGEWPDFPVRFAYWFQANSGGMDLEHQHIVERYEAKRSLFSDPDPFWKPPEEDPSAKRRKKKPPKPDPIPTSVYVTVQPHVREFLFAVRWILYLDPPELIDAFRSPVFPVSLGRSQDLACIADLATITLESAAGGYYEHTLLPISFRKHMALGVTAMMPSFIAPTPSRDPEFEPYILLRERVFAGTAADEDTSRRFLRTEGESDGPHWTDPTTESRRDVKRALWFHEIQPYQAAND